MSGNLALRFEENMMFEVGSLRWIVDLKKNKNKQIEKEKREHGKTDIGIRI